MAVYYALRDLDDALLSTERPCVSRSRSLARLWLSFAAPATSVAESSEAVLDKDRLFAIKRGGSVGGWSLFLCM